MAYRSDSSEGGHQGVPGPGGGNGEDGMEFLVYIRHGKCAEMHLKAFN